MKQVFVRRPNDRQNFTQLAKAEVLSESNDMLRVVLEGQTKVTEVKASDVIRVNATRTGGQIIQKVDAPLNSFARKHN